jgi:hypothetical protein
MMFGNSERFWGDGELIRRLHASVGLKQVLSVSRMSENQLFSMHSLPRVLQARTIRFAPSSRMSESFRYLIPGSQKSISSFLVKNGSRPFSGSSILPASFGARRKGRD